MTHTNTLQLVISKEINSAKIVTGSPVRVAYSYGMKTCKLGFTDGAHELSTPMDRCTPQRHMASSTSPQQASGTSSRQASTSSCASTWHSPATQVACSPLVVACELRRSPRKTANTGCVNMPTGVSGSAQVAARKSPRKIASPAPVRMPEALSDDPQLIMSTRKSPRKASNAQPAEMATPRRVTIGMLSTPTDVVLLSSHHKKISSSKSVNDFT